MPSMNNKQAFMHTFSYNGNLYSIGGFVRPDISKPEYFTDNVEYLEYGKQKWIVLQKLPKARGLFNFALTENLCFIFGGVSKVSPTSTQIEENRNIDILNLTNNTWSSYANKLPLYKD